MVEGGLISEGAGNQMGLRNKFQGRPVIWFPEVSGGPERLHLIRRRRRESACAAVTESPMDK